MRSGNAIFTLIRPFSHLFSRVDGAWPWVPRVPGPPAPPPGNWFRVPGGPRRRPGWGFRSLPTRLQFRRACRASRAPDTIRDRIFVGDCIAALERLPAESVDVVFADPPYNLQLENALTRPDQSLVDAVDDDWDKFASFQAYDDFTRAWLAAVRRVMKKSATLWVIGSYHNIFRVGSALQDLGFLGRSNDIVWRKANPMPNFRGKRFTNAHETLIWASKSADAKGYTFHYDALKGGNDDLQMRSDWFIPLCTGGRAPQGRKRRQAPPDAEARGAARPRAAVFLQSRRRGARPVLPAPARRAAVAKKLGRHFVGIDAGDPGYAAAARRAIAAVEAALAEAIAAAPEKKKGKESEPRVPFLSIVESGFVSPGEQLICGRRRHRAVVRAGRDSWALGPDRRLDPQRSARSRRGFPPATVGPSGTPSRDRGARADRRLPRPGSGHVSRPDGALLRPPPSAAAAPSAAALDEHVARDRDDDERDARDLEGAERLPD